MTHSRTFAARAAAASAALALLAAPLVARDEDKPVTDESVSARDVAVTPLEDFNLSKDPIPEILLEAQKDPYATAGLKKCSDYSGAVTRLDAVLGPDFDIATAEERGMTVGTVAKSVVGALIPFRGVIREISGANKHEREFRDAIVAGVMRRAFLKGMGLKLGCKYPARPAGDAERKAYAAEIAAREAADGKDKKKD